LDAPNTSMVVVDVVGITVCVVVDVGSTAGVTPKLIGSAK